MSKLLASLMAVALGFGFSLAGAQNVNADKDKAQGQTQGAGAANQQRPSTSTPANEAARAAAGQASKTAKDCDKLSGKEKQNCIEKVSPATGEMKTDQGEKGKTGATDQHQPANEAARAATGQDANKKPK